MSFLKLNPNDLRITTFHFYQKLIFWESKKIRFLACKIPLHHSSKVSCFFTTCWNPPWNQFCQWIPKQVNFIHQIYGQFLSSCKSSHCLLYFRRQRQHLLSTTPIKRKLALQIYRILSCRGTLNCTHCYCVALSLKPLWPDFISLISLQLKPLNYLSWVCSFHHR